MSDCDKTPLTDEQKAGLQEDLLAPRNVSSDGLSVTNRTVEELHAIEDRLCTQAVTGGRRATGIRLTLINSPGAVRRVNR